MSKTNRVFSAEFRTQVAQRILQGEGIAKLHREFEIKKSVLYRWRDRFLREGAAGLDRKPGRPPAIPNPTAAPKPGVSTEETLRRRMAELERKIGQQVHSTPSRL